MEYSRWEPFYHQIIEDFEFDEEEDFNAGKVLSELLQDVNNTENHSEIGKLISGKEIYIFGGGPSLKKDVPRLFKRADREKLLPTGEELERPTELKMPNEYGFPQTWIAADIATSTLLDYGIIPHIIVTDLDGIVEDHLLANEKGAYLVIHAHGDNQDKLKEFVPKVKQRVIGTMATTPETFENLYNFGGFTDGDRAVYLADQFDSGNMLLIAYNFRDPSRKRGEEIAQEEEDPKMKIKAKKLTWANVLIAMLDNDNIRFFDER
jgi:uncharacterized Rossmann fold enzyme